jgi:hypothetical protein
MIEDYNGATVVDAAGERIGTVARSYVNDDGMVQVISVKLGTLFAKHRLVPVDGLHPTDGALRLPYPKALIEDVPAVDADDALAGEALAQVRRHYAMLRDVPVAPVRSGDDGAPPRGERSGPADDDGMQPTATAIRDEGEVVEIPIVEEELVKRPVVKEVVRVRKETVTRQQPVETTLRREELVVDEQGEVDVTTDDASEAGDSRSEPPPTPDELRRFAEAGEGRTSLTERTDWEPDTGHRENRVADTTAASRASNDSRRG